jgi:hypothetical protein
MGGVGPDAVAAINRLHVRAVIYGECSDEREAGGQLLRQVRRQAIDVVLDAFGGGDYE